MKKKLAFYLIFLLFPGYYIKAQTGGYLDINNVKAKINSDGFLFADYTNWTPAEFEVPKGSGLSTIFAGNLWIGGIDVGGQLKLAAQTYRQTGQDFYYGPLPGPAPSQWDRVWKINKSTVDSFRLGLFQIIPQIILDWPGNGNVAIGHAQNLAPYFDANSDNIYDPNVGDYPCIRGDQTVYFIFNDNGPHTESGGYKFPIEIHGMAYAFNNPTDIAINHSLFLHYKIIHRSTLQCDSVYIGNWTDFDLGCYADDFISSDVERSMYYTYNGDKKDDTVSCFGYGNFPPAQATVFLNGPTANSAVVGDGIDNDHNCIVDEPNENLVMSNFLYYNGSGGPNGNPVSVTHYNNYLQSTWGDGLPVRYGNDGYNSLGPNCTYMFPGISDQTYGWGTGGNCTTQNIQTPWDEKNTGNIPADRRGVGSYGPFTLLPGEEICFDFAYVWARTKDTINDTVSVAALQNAIDTVRNFYFTNKLDSCICTIAPLGVIDGSENSFNFYVSPNPNSGIFLINNVEAKQSSSIAIFNVLGEKIHELSKESIPRATNKQIGIDLSDQPNGIYFVQLKTAEGVVAKKIVVHR